MPLLKSTMARAGWKKISLTAMYVSAFFFSSRRRHTRLQGDWSSDVCSSDLSRVIYQSAPALPPGTPNRHTFDVIMVGHLREVKDPLTPMRALSGLPDDSAV